MYARLKASWNSNINADSEKKMDFEVCKSHRIHLPYAIITRGYPIFHSGLYCRAVYNAERLTFHIFSANLYKDAIKMATFL